MGRSNANGNETVVNDITEQESEEATEIKVEEKTFTQEELNSILAKEKAKLQKAIDEKVNEAAKLAKMTADQKAQYESEKRLKELDDREKNITRRELMAEAKNTLSDKNLPTSLADLLDYTDADMCSNSIETISKAFQEAVESAVEDRLKGGKPQKKAPETEILGEKQQLEKDMNDYTLPLAQRVAAKNKLYSMKEE